VRAVLGAPLVAAVLAASAACATAPAPSVAVAPAPDTAAALPPVPDPELPRLARLLDAGTRAFALPPLPSVRAVVGDDHRHYAGYDGRGAPRYVRRRFTDYERQLLRWAYGIEDPNRLWLPDSTPHAILRYDTRLVDGVVLVARVGYPSARRPGETWDAFADRLASGRREEFRRGASVTYSSLDYARPRRALGIRAPARRRRAPGLPRARARDAAHARAAGLPLLGGRRAHVHGDVGAHGGARDRPRGRRRRPAQPGDGERVGGVPPLGADAAHGVGRALPAASAPWTGRGTGRTSSSRTTRSASAPVDDLLASAAAKAAQAERARLAKAAAGARQRPGRRRNAPGRREAARRGTCRAGRGSCQVPSSQRALVRPPMRPASSLRPAVLAAVLLGVGVTACETEGVGGPEPTVPGSLSATINDAPWRANAPVGYGNDVGQISPTGREVLVVGGELSTIGASARIIALRLNNFSGLGTYTLGTRAADPRTGPSFAVLQLSRGRKPIAAYETVSGPAAGTVTVTTWDPADAAHRGTVRPSPRGRARRTAVVSIADGSSRGGSACRSSERARRRRRARALRRDQPAVEHQGVADDERARRRAQVADRLGDLLGGAEAAEGTRAVRARSASAAPPVMRSTMGVLVKPGQTALTRTPRRAYSSAAVRVRPTTPCLLAA
jgi:hypothetical protein